MAPELAMKDGAVGAGVLSHLSYSRVNRYLLCPEQYRLYYVAGYRTRVPSGSLEFGQCVHRSLSDLFNEGVDAAESFVRLWNDYEKQELHFAYRESWKTLRERGELLLRKFQDEELPRITSVEACEDRFELRTTNLDVPFVGVIDLVARLDDRTTIVDFKTAGSKYAEHEVVLNDQLTAYQLAKPDAKQAALCVFVKTKEPRIDWYVSKRTGAQVAEYLTKVKLVSQDILSGRFYKRPGKWCAQCDFLPICMGDEQQANETLVQVA
ncbi:MAG: PD-(D/E)XK nuclease family protein [Candidatus Hydrogenedentota bacterium]